MRKKDQSKTASKVGVTMYDRDRDRALSIGQGNLSEGIREAIRAYKVEALAAQDENVSAAELIKAIEANGKEIDGTIQWFVPGGWDRRRMDRAYDRLKLGWVHGEADDGATDSFGWWLNYTTMQILWYSSDTWRLRTCSTAEEFERYAADARRVARER